MVLHNPAPAPSQAIASSHKDRVSRDVRVWLRSLWELAQACDEASRPS